MTDNSFNSDPPLALVGESSRETPARSAIRKKASTACSACRSRRSKCTGGSPCLSCKTHGTECIKDETEDGRRRIAIKRKLDKFEEDRALLSGLINALKYGNHMETTAIVNLIRTNTSRSDLSTIINEILTSPAHVAEEPQSKHWKVEEFADVSSRGHRRRTGGIGDVLNPPIQVPSKPWTKVIDDDDHVSHLISLWFTWMYPWCRWVEYGAFVQAMQSRDLDSPLCTPYLVSSILAEACLLDSTQPADESHHSRLRQAFLAEAKAGIEAEKGRASLTLVQALGVSWTDLYLDGEGLVGRVELNTQSLFIKDLEKWRIRLAKSDDIPPGVLNQVDVCLNFVEWVQFALRCFDLADDQKSDPARSPEVPKPKLSHEDQISSTWIAYPLYRGAQSEFHSECHFASLLSLAEITSRNELLSLKREQGSAQDEQFSNIVKSLHEWPQELPECMNYQTAAVPHVLVLHALYNWVMLIVSKQAAAAEAGKPKVPVITRTPTPPSGDLHYRVLSISYALKIAEIMRNYTRQWGTDYFPPMIVQPVCLGLLTLFEDLTEEAHREAFVTLHRTLQALSGKYRVAKGVLDIVKRVIADKPIAASVDVGSPEEAQHQSIPSMDEGEGEGESTIVRPETTSPENDITVDYLLQKWHDLDSNSDSD